MTAHTIDGPDGSDDWSEDRERADDLLLDMEDARADAYLETLPEGAT